MSASGDFDADLAAALAASIEDHRQEHTELVLSSGFAAQVSARARVCHSLSLSLTLCLCLSVRTSRGLVALL